MTSDGTVKESRTSIGDSNNEIRIRAKSRPSPYSPYQWHVFRRNITATQVSTWRRERSFSDTMSLKRKINSPFSRKKGNETYTIDNEFDCITCGCLNSIGIVYETARSNSDSMINRLHQCNSENKKCSDNRVHRCGRKRKIQIRPKESRLSLTFCRIENYIIKQADTVRLNAR